MAKKKPITAKVIKEEPIAEKVVEVITEKVIEEETVTVIGVASAEQLQKSGWQLIDCHLAPEGKEYKFRKVI